MAHQELRKFAEDVPQDGYSRIIARTGDHFGDVRIAIEHNHEVGMIVAWIAGKFQADGVPPFGEIYRTLYADDAAGFMAGIGFLPDPAESGTWYEAGAFCKVPDWIELTPGGVRIRRGDPEFLEEMRRTFRVVGSGLS